MANYIEWNNGIYDFYFKDFNIIKSRTFSVNERVINIIGEQIGIKENATDNFCKCVINQMRSGNIIKIPEKDYSSNIIPGQTAILAFFIYIAGLMGSDDDYSTNAYWTMLNGDDYRDGFIKKKMGIKLNISPGGKKNLKDLFENFAKKISYNLGVDYHFSNFFSKPYIGLPMTQAMITERDYCLLTQKFAGIKNELEIYKWNFHKDNGFSPILRKVNNEEHPQLISGILELYKDWDGNVLDFDEIKFKRNRKFINLLYAYSESRGKFQYYYTAEARDDYEDILFPQIILRKKDNSKYYQKVQIEDRFVSLKITPSYSTNYKNLPILRRDTEYIKLKEEERGYFIEQTTGNAIKEGDRFSIIATKRFFEEYAEDIDILTDDDIDWNALPKIDGTDLCLLHNIEAAYGRYDNNFVAFNSANKIRFKKGLKSGNGNYNWIEGAEPIIELNDMASVKIDGIKEKNQQEIDIRKRDEYKSIGKHEIKLDKSGVTKFYYIEPMNKIAEPTEFKKNYHIIVDCQIEHSNNKKTDTPIIFGAYIDNVSIDNSTKILINNKKLSYILTMLEKHDNQKKYEMPCSIKELLEVIVNNCDNSNRLIIKKYLDNNIKIDNHICIYLNRIKEVIYE